MANNNGEVTFNVTKSIWRLNRSSNGWQKEVNLVAWNSNKPRIDIREWNGDKTKMKKGITLSKEEVLELRKCLNTVDLDLLYDDVNAETDVQTEPGPAGGVYSAAVAVPVAAGGAKASDADDASDKMQDDGEIPFE